jgi:glycolate oxidase iron-sulfur subunit
LRRIGNVVWLMQKTGALALLRKTGIIRMVSAPMAQFETALPAMAAPSKRLKMGRIYPVEITTPKARMALFTGCIMDAMLFRVHRLTVELLQGLGVEVIVSTDQKCCGALHLHQGMTEGAYMLAKANIEAFELLDADWVVNNAGSCGAALKEYGQLFKGDPEWAERAKRFSEKSRDISEILLQYGPLPYKEQAGVCVTYQDSCHLLNVQKVSDAPRKLLKHIPGVHYVEMKGADRCCGSGGIYNLLHFDESMVILNEKSSI